MSHHTLDAQVAAYLRAVLATGDAYQQSLAFGERLGRFLTDTLEPLLDACNRHDVDPRENVLLPVAQLLRQAADRLERGG